MTAAIAIERCRLGGLGLMTNSTENTILNGDMLGVEFHNLFRSNLDQSRKKSKKKKPKKKLKQVKLKDKQKTKSDNATEPPFIQAPTVEVCSNPSSFAVYAGVRQSVLEKHIHDAAQIFLVANTSQFSDSENEEEEEEKTKDVIHRIPKIVGIGLCSVFELIRESRLSHPSLCTLALEALLDILQGQQPEGLKSEPADVIDSLFNLLLELASQPSADAKKNSHTSRLTSVACSCLLSLVVARGDTGKLLSAASAMLMSDKSLASEDLKMPYVLTSLQRSVHAVLLGKTIIPDWITNGILKKGLIDTFKVHFLEEKNESLHYTMASDGRWLYIHSSQGNLFKVGTGFGGTIRGHLSTHRSDFYPRDKGWLGVAENRLFYKSSTSTNMLTVLDQESLKEAETVFFDGKDIGPSVTFSDGENIGTITSAKDDSFVVRAYCSTYSQMPCISELPLKLARKCLDIFGWAAFDEEIGIHTIVTAFDDEPTIIAAGKEFALMRTTSGKILYTGKAPSLGIKQGGAAANRWVELPITKSPKIVQFSVGHEGLHALLVAEDGGVFFVGIARRGEDGDQSKGRRQPKPVKPKKMIKVESLNVTYSACNNGTSALITKDGELYMFGKDTAHCHHATGLVVDLKDVSLTQVALGKAHVVALSNKGHVYTFGINNKGQCGRDFATHSKDAVMSVAMATTNEEDGDDEEIEAEEPDVMCLSGQHKWRQDECMVCTVCGECTGFGVSCISKGQPDRNPGLPCGCGWGDSGCSECGCCKTCAGENKAVDSLLAAELDIIMRRRPGNRLQDQIQRKLDERRHRHKAKASSKSLKVHVKTLRNYAEPPQEKGVVAAMAEEVVSSDQERETSKITSLSPARVILAGDFFITSVACGLHHTVLLLQSGDVFTFGSNQHGQLGVGDLTPRGSPVAVRLPNPATHIAAGSNHTIVLIASGLVYTFGSYQKGQLGRTPPQSHAEDGRKEKSSREAPWFSVPGAVPNIGPKYGRRPTWVGASGDQTFLKIDESLINSHNLTHSTVVANKTSICLIPTVPSSFKCLLINKADGNCRSFSDNEQIDLANSCACIDPAYNVIWSFSPINAEINCYSVVAAEANSPSSVSHFQKAANTGSNLASNAIVKLNISSVPYVLTPALATPGQPRYQVTRSQAALHLLSCLDTLALAQELHWKVHEEEADLQSVAKVYNKEDFAAVNRFESHGGGWGYSGHSIEAIRFMADTDVLLGGFGLFGGRGEYTGKIKLFDIGMEGGDQEIDGELLTETEEVPYECGARQKYPMLFDEPIALQANRWYVAWARVSGPSSDCGSSGQCVITTEDQVAFYFKSSKKSNNGTDVNAGQIPQLLYKVITHESHATSYRSDICEPVFILSREFSRTVTPDSLQSLLQLLEWSWLTFKTTLAMLHPGQQSDLAFMATSIDLERLVYISCASLRLLRTYINEVYPNHVTVGRNSPELTRLVECVADTRCLLRSILSDPLPIPTPAKSSNNHVHKHTKGNLHEASTIYAKAVAILDECHTTFVACFHAFYPTSHLKWTCLCDLLGAMESDPVKADGCDHLLAAILASLCSPTVKLTSVLPIVFEAEDCSPRKHHSVAGSSLDMTPGSSTEAKYPLLIEHMLQKSQREETIRAPCTFREVLNRLLANVVRPVQLALGHEKSAPSPKLVANTCALLAAIIAELAAQTTGLDADLHSSGGRVLHITPSRFTRTSQSRTWNTGNGSPDAICFSVDRPGIVIIGVTLYGGVGTYDYELELLDDQNGSSSDPSHTQRWNSLEIVRGTFGPDDCVADAVEVKFDHAVGIKENTKYAIRLRNHGGRTSNGDGGLNAVKGSDGTTFAFTTCSLSFNGTNHTRGQLPQILYYSTPQDSDCQQDNRAIIELQARKSALSIATTIVKAATTLLQQARDEADEKVMDVLSSAYVTSMLLPLVLAHIAPIATSDPRSAVQVLEMIQDVLPPVAHLNNRFHNLKVPLVVSNELTAHDSSLSTTSNHYAIVESDHPYKPASVSTYKVCFPETVKWMSLEFDSQCGTAQSEDALQLYIPSQESAFKVPCSTKLIENDEVLQCPYWPILRKFSGSNTWPRCSIILPGNEVIFSLETASDYVKDDKACFYGFKCLVVGYDWARASEEGLRHLEEELAYLGGMCASSLMKKDLLLPPASVDEMEDDLDIVDEIAQQIYNTHLGLLGKGFAIAHAPSVHQALEGVLPFSYLSNERSFLKDFVLCSPGTSGGRLARWLQPDSYVDLKHCEVIFNKDEMRCGWPTVVTVVTKDQYEEIVNVPHLKLEVKAIPIDKRDHGVEDSNRKVPRMSKPDSLTFGGNPLPNIAVPYEVTVKDKMCYYAISMMKAYENYSFEELRYTTPVLKRPSENMMVRANNDGTYSCNWTPSSVGWYLVHVSIDSFEIENTRKVEVKEPPQGVVPPSQTLAKKCSTQPNKVRRFVAKSSAGLRVRAHPSLQSEQIGTVNVNGVITFIDELHNDDGVWVRLNIETIKMYCHNGYAEAWCLQYNQHLGRTLLVPLEEPKPFLDDVLVENRLSRLSESSCHETERIKTGGPGIYHVVKCGASGHNIRSTPSLKAPPVGMLVLGNQLNVTEEMTNLDGSWVKLDQDSVRRFCFNTEGDAWSLAQSRGDVVYLQHENDINLGSQVDSANKSSSEDVNYVNGANGSVVGNRTSNFWTCTTPSIVNAVKPFDFSNAVQNPVAPSFGPNDNQGIFTFGPANGELDDNSPGLVAPSFAFGAAAVRSASIASPPLVPPKPAIPDRRIIPNPPVRSTSVVQKWIRGEENRWDQHHSPTFREASVPPELLGVSVKELVKVLGESRANGNEATPPQTPPGTPPHRLSRSSSPKQAVVGSPRAFNSRESSPVLIPGAKVNHVPADSAGSSPSSINSISASPQLGSSPASSALPMFRRSSTQSEYSSHGTPPLNQATVLPLRRATTTTEICDSSSKSFVQAGTQTSPDGCKGHFSIGTGTRKDDSIRLSPKLARKDRAIRQLRSKRERAQSPARNPRDQGGKEHHPKEPVKNAMSPLVAECLRAVFAAFLWHEGIVHDAMACASFLKFHPDLPKQLPKVPNPDTAGEKPVEMLSKEQKARLRHSVEVSACNFLTIQPSTAEAFARSLANANVNKNKMPKPTETIREESASTVSLECKSNCVDSVKKALNDTVASSPVTGSFTTAVQSPVTHSGSWTGERKAESDLPLSLQHLLGLWELLTSEMLKMMSQQLSLPVPVISTRIAKSNDGKDKESERKSRKKKEWRLSAIGRGNLFGEAAGGPFGGPERETMCELCGKLYPHPVTYHMRQAHPGCGGHAGGKGYNSGGNFCGGWAGNCGDGGVGGSSWYLICDRCREKYLRHKRQISLKEKSRKNRKKMSPGKLLSPLPPLETHQIMKQNATFLLDLASASGAGMTSHPLPSNKRSPHSGSSSTGSNMPSLNEYSPLEPIPFPLSGFQCRHILGIQQVDVNLLSDNFLLEESLQQNRDLGINLRGRGVDDGGVVTLHSLSEIDDNGEPTSFGSDGPGSSDTESPRGRMFHRSISVGTTTREWNREEGEGRIIMTRKRNKSSGEGVEDGSSLLCHPSATLTKLIAMATEKGNSAEILARPILSFILQRHDLQSLRLAMKQAVRKAACRAFAMQGINWLIRSVTQPTALHDLLWFFVAALTPLPDIGEENDEEDNGEKKVREHEHQDKDVAVCDHPLSDITIAGDTVRPLVSAFHTLLQSISDLMMMLPMGSALQQMAMRCWCLKFRQSDHVFLHRSHVFSNISKILSRSEEELCGDGDGNSSMGDSFQSTGVVECLKDLTSTVDLKASSRPGMLGSLVDNSTETFWESGDEDRNKTKILTMTCSSNKIPRMIYVHVDNCRDLGNKVASITFKAGLHQEELIKLRQLEVESRYTGWISCPIKDCQPTVIRLELKGSDNTLRVRQVKVLGELEGESLQVGKAHSAGIVQQRNCEAETLKVFRMLTSQVFGKLISSDGTAKDEKSVEIAAVCDTLDYDKVEGNNDLKEHMVGILFSRSKLTHLQKQVCTHIVQAIRKEAARVREEWEALLCSKSLSMEELPKSSDAYCFEMLSMVLALSGSSVGRAYLAQQGSLLKDLLSLLHTGSARVQRQVTSLLRRVLPEVSPLAFAQILGAKSLPPTDYSIVSDAVKTNESRELSFDIHKMGILDVFFSCIAKALTVQMKVKGKESNKGITTVTLATSIHPRDFMGSRWWLRGCITRKLAEVIIQLLQDMAAGKLSDEWASITKGAVAENILNLTKLDECCRTPSDCLKTPTLWLALSSLCVLDQDHVERLSSGQWAGTADGQQASSRPTCDNHDDGETLAIILCNSCGNLCADCDRFLHLHRRTHAHQRQVFKEEEEAIKVDLHEGCGRTKLFWIMALADSKTLKAMVEFREGAKGKSATSAAGTCRFCGAMGETGLLAIGNVCAEVECQEHARSSCIKSLSCGHMCGGIRNEINCLPCLHGCSNDTTLKQDADDMCMICFTEALSCAPALQLRCGHIFHLHCCNSVLSRKWTGPRITFGFSLCPICKSTIEHPILKDLLDPVRGLFDDVKRKALMRLEYEGLHKAEAITTPGARFYADPAGYAMERYAYYVCYKCKKAYYGGEVRCDIEAGGGDDYDPAELVCGACSDVSRAQMCPKHGTDFLEYKCRYCCSVAVFFCFGTTHFCNACHDDFQHVTNIPKHELPHCPAGPKGKQLDGDECPLHIQHPLTGEEFALGCGVCRNAHTF